MADRVTPRAGVGLAAFAGVVAATALWWGLALWPLPPAAPGWIARARAICFGSTASGLPDASGWLALALQPATMAALMVAVWGRELTAGLRAARRSGAGRAALALTGLVLVGLAGLAAWRVAGASAAVSGTTAASPGRVTSLAGPAPPLPLTDQGGAPFDLARLRGRPVLIVFAFAHCQTVCPLLVQEARAAQREAADTGLVVVTLDPWRDTPSRLPHLARQWDLGEDGWVLSGTVPEVEAALDAWGVERSRNRRNGDIVHAARVFVVDRDGHLAYETGGGAATLTALLRSL